MDVQTRDISREIALKHGDTRVAALRRIYGAAFGTNVDGRKPLAEVIEALDVPSLNALVDDYRAGLLFGTAD